MHGDVPKANRKNVAERKAGENRQGANCLRQERSFDAPDMTEEQEKFEG